MAYGTTDLLSLGTAAHLRVGVDDGQ